MTAPIRSLSTELDESERWLHELMDELDLADERRALRALRAGLHTIRDRLPTIEAIELASALPTLLRGIFYEGWRLPTILRPQHRDQILSAVRARLGRDVAVDADEVLRAVIRLLERHRRIELGNVQAALPQPMADLWIESVRPDPTMRATSEGPSSRKENHGQGEPSCDAA